MSDSTRQPFAVTTKEAARLCGISERHLLKLDDDGKLGPTALRLGNCVRWNVSEIEEWLNAGCPDRERWIAIRQRAAVDSIVG